MVKQISFLETSIDTIMNIVDRLPPSGIDANPTFMDRFEITGELLYRYSFKRTATSINISRHEVLNLRSLLNTEYLDGDLLAGNSVSLGSFEYSFSRFCCILSRRIGKIYLIKLETKRVLQTITLPDTTVNSQNPFKIDEVTQFSLNFHRNLGAILTYVRKVNTGMFNGMPLCEDHMICLSWKHRKDCKSQPITFDPFLRCTNIQLFKGIAIYSGIKSYIADEKVQFYFLIGQTDYQVDISLIRNKIKKRFGNMYDIGSKSKPFKGQINKIKVFTNQNEGSNILSEIKESTMIDSSEHSKLDFEKIHGKFDSLSGQNHFDSKARKPCPIGLSTSSQFDPIKKEKKTGYFSKDGKPDDSRTKQDVINPKAPLFKKKRYWVVRKFIQQPTNLDDNEKMGWPGEYFYQQVAPDCVWDFTDPTRWLGNPGDSLGDPEQPWYVRVKTHDPPTQFSPNEPGKLSASLRTLYPYEFKS